MSFNKSKNRKEGWGINFLLVFFPEDSNSTAINVDNNKLFSHSSSLRRTNSSRLFTKARSTISICALLVFVTLLLFTLSTFEPNSRTQAPIGFASRRFLAEVRSPRMWRRNNTLSHGLKSESRSRPQRALQGLGTLYRRGTKSVSDLVVAHVAEETKEDELRLFLRALHRSGLTAKSDVVLLFPSPSHQSKFESLIQEENDYFLTLVKKHSEVNKTSSSPAVKHPGLTFDPAQFRPGKKEPGEPIWGKKVSSNESTQLSYGSVVGFDTSELDPENSLAGFMEQHAVPMGLRRWACYPMLLGRVRRNFKHVALLDARTAVPLGDQVGPGGPRSPESVHFYEGPGPKHKPKVNAGVISGGARGVRRLSDAMLAEIVRVASAGQQQHKKKGCALTDSAVLTQLVGNENLLKNVKAVRPGEPVAEASDLSFLKRGVVQRGVGNGNNNGHEIVKSVIMNHICANEVDSSVYRDCPQKVI